jgi:hypothetical protein
MPLVVIAIAVAITVLLNPGLDGSVVLSSYADCGTMVAVGALGLLGVEILARLSRGEPANVEGIAWRFGFVGAMLVNLKQANPVLLALITAGLILVAFRDPALRTRRALLQLPRMLGPGSSSSRCGAGTSCTIYPTQNKSSDRWKLGISTPFPPFSGQSGFTSPMRRCFTA